MKSNTIHAIGDSAWKRATPERKARWLRNQIEYNSALLGSYTDSISNSFGIQRHLDRCSKLLEQIDARVE